jgi:oligopeptide transport system substrate-binding protein
MRDTWTNDPEQAALFCRRSEAAGLSRRQFMTILAAAAGSAAVPGLAGAAPAPADAAAPAGAKAVADAEQVFRFPAWPEPSSHDFNKDLYCSGETELFAGLARFDTDYKPVPYVAERWEAKAGGAEYVFYIRRGLRWTNGDPVTAADFEWSFKRQLDPETKASYSAFLFDIKNGEGSTPRNPGSRGTWWASKRSGPTCCPSPLRGPAAISPRSWPTSPPSPPTGRRWKSTATSGPRRATS